eukprot:scaffold298_cov247-Pinguiococcus_pyrenoidosus.AAC.18
MKGAKSTDSLKKSREGFASRFPIGTQGRDVVPVLLKVRENGSEDLFRRILVGPPLERAIVGGDQSADVLQGFSLLGWGLDPQPRPKILRRCQRGLQHGLEREQQMSVLLHPTIPKSHQIREWLGASSHVVVREGRGRGHGHESDVGDVSQEGGILQLPVVLDHVHDELLGIPAQRRRQRRLRRRPLLRCRLCLEAFRTGDEGLAVEASLEPNIREHPQPFLGAKLLGWEQAAFASLEDDAEQLVLWVVELGGSHQLLRVRTNNRDGDEGGVSELLNHSVVLLETGPVVHDEVEHLRAISLRQVGEIGQSEAVQHPNVVDFLDAEISKQVLQGSLRLQQGFAGGARPREVRSGGVAEDHIVPTFKLHGLAVHSFIGEEALELLNLRGAESHGHPGRVQAEQQVVGDAGSAVKEGFPLQLVVPVVQRQGGKHAAGDLCGAVHDELGMLFGDARWACVTSSPTSSLGPSAERAAAAAGDGGGGGGAASELAPSDPLPLPAGVSRPCCSALVSDLASVREEGAPGLASSAPSGDPPERLLAASGAVSFSSSACTSLANP